MTSYVAREALFYFRQAMFLAQFLFCQLVYVTNELLYFVSPFGLNVYEKGQPLDEKVMSLQDKKIDLTSALFLKSLLLTLRLDWFIVFLYPLRLVSLTIRIFSFFLFIFIKHYYKVL